MFGPKIPPSWLKKIYVGSVSYHNVSLLLACQPPKFAASKKYGKPICHTKKSTLSHKLESQYGIIPQVIPSLATHIWTTTYHHDGISAAFEGKLNYLGRQAESGITTVPAMLPTTQKRPAMCARWENIEVPFCTFCLHWFFFEFKTEAPAMPGVIPHPS